MDLKGVGGINGELRRRVSPRLHHNDTDLDGDGDGVGDSVPRRLRFSPRLAKQSGRLPNPKTPAPNLYNPDSNLPRRVSPRLHGDLGPTSGACFASSDVHLHRRFSPRLRQNTPTSTSSVEKKSNAPAGNPVLRRFSPRLRTSPPENSVAGGKSLHVSLANDLACVKRSNGHSETGHSKPDFERSYVHEITSASNMTMKAWTNKAPHLAGRSDHAKVKETLRLFNSYYLQCAQEEEERCKQSGIAIKNKKTSMAKEKVKGTSSRPDLKALKKMMSKKEILYPKKTYGHLPGIDVGCKFYSRAEMVAVGIHSHWLNGIDYIGSSKGKKEYAKYTLPIAVAVVLSGQYEDDLDNADHIVYTGEGGNDLLGSKLQCGNQLLVRGNLAMKNNLDQSLPVRVIRGCKNADSYTGKIYSYDGLYKVVDYWPDEGCRGFLVYKFRLKRIQGQPKLTTDQVQFVRGCPLKAVSELPGLVCRDISNGVEEIGIPVTNIVDNPPVCPPEFTYIKSIEVAKGVKLPPSATGCKCKDKCTNPKTCACAKLNGEDFPYVHRDGGRLAEPKDVVFECGPNCHCKPCCLNRTSQRRIKYRLEVYRTPNKGWAVRSWDYIPSGAPVCEYIGVLRRSDELDNIAGNEYIFEIDCLHTINEIEGRERRLGNVHVSPDISLSKNDKMLDGTPEFCIDAGSRGNVARFINHSCDPNMFVQCILSEHHDLRLARIVLIAANNISPMQELTYDYGYALDSVVGADGKIRVLPCFCGTEDCRKRLY